MSFSRHVALITGANTGMTRPSLAPSLLDTGTTARSIRFHGATRPLGREFNPAAKTIEADHGRLDVLVHNAAIYTEPDPSNAYLTVRKRFEKTFVPNLLGQVGITEVVLPLLKRIMTDGGVPRIVFVSPRIRSLANALASNSTRISAPTIVARRR
ncbi:hypothetical protein F5B19DRAFT_493177 [Rostrohypoxylon terebratum]|nr:hypothetical protein F5B19DRAFT_493177 [Rostrohypoxylon terebratum]